MVVTTRDQRMGERRDTDQRIQTFSCKMNKFQGPNVQHGDCVCVCVCVSVCLCVCVCVCVCVCLFSVTQLCLTLCNPMDCSLPRLLSPWNFTGRNWRGQPFPTPGDVPNPRIKLPFPVSPAVAGRFFTTISPLTTMYCILEICQDSRSQVFSAAPPPPTSCHKKR